MISTLHIAKRIADFAEQSDTLHKRDQRGGDEA